MLKKDLKVRKPDQRVKVVNTKSGAYVYYVEKYFYDKNKKYPNDKRVLIGKMIDDEFMIPNERFLSCFPDRASEMLSNVVGDFSDTLHVGIATVINKVLNDTSIGKLLDDVFDDKSSLIKDVISYMIIEESCKYEDFPFYEREHLTNTYKTYSDSSVSDLLKDDISSVKIKNFLDSWNNMNSDIDDVYINVDATNINVVNEFEGLGEYGKAKDDDTLPQVNITYMSKAVDNTPLNYALYHGSVNDAAQFRFMAKDINGYGYKNIGFIMDRIYYSKEMYTNLVGSGYSLLCALRGNYDFINDMYNEYSIELREMVTCYISDYELSGKSKKIALDKKRNRNVYGYVHLYYDDKLATMQKDAILQKVNENEKVITKLLEESKDVKPEELSKYDKYFRFKVDKITQRVIGYTRKNKDILEETKRCGFFALLSSKDMSAKEAIEIYRKRDGVEKLFRALKTSMGFDHVGVHSRASLEAKVFLTFVASIVRNEIYKATRKLDDKQRKTYTVPRVIKELETIEATLDTNGNYYRKYVITAKQRKLLNLFELEDSDIDDMILAFNNNRK